MVASRRPVRIAILTLDSLYSSFALKNLISVLRTRVELVVCTERINNKKYGSFIAQAKKIISKSGIMFFLYLNFYVFVYRFLVYLSGVYCWLFRKKRRTYAISWLAKRYNFRIVKTPDVNDAAVVRLLKKYNIDLVVSIHLDQLVGKDILNYPKRGCINLHYGELPQNAGPFPTIWSILRGHDRVAVTIHYMNECFDQGSVLACEKVSIKENESVLALDCRLMKYGVRVLKKVIHEIENGNQKTSTQDMSQFRYRSYPSKNKLALLNKRNFNLMQFRDLKAFFF